MSAVLPLLAASLMGYGLVRLLRPPWPGPALVGAGLALGPPLASLLLYSATEAGLPYGRPLAFGLLSLGGLLAVMGARRPAGEPLPFRRWVLPLVLTVGMFLQVGLSLLALPAPQGDGLAIYATKARFAHATGETWTLLRDPRAQALHPDYPLHQPLLMQLGFLLSGGTEALPALSGGLLMLPGAMLFLASLAARRGILPGVVVALAGALVPALRHYVTAGYADPALTAVLAVAGGALAVGGARPAAAALAAGLLPWIKLEGAVYLVVLLLVACWRRPFQGWSLGRFLLLAASLGSIWPSTLLARDLGLTLVEEVAPAGTPERLAAVAQAFAGPLVDPRQPFALLWVPVLLATVHALIRHSKGASAVLAPVVLLGLLAGPLMSWARNTSVLSLQGDLALRLESHVLPLGIFLLAAEFITPRSPSDRFGSG